MKNVTLVVTVLNEASTILELLESIKRQSSNPKEVVLVDGGSSDETLELAKNFSKQNPKLNLKVYKKLGNRSVGRNFAISKSENDWIAITDAGCTLDKNWLKELLKRQRKHNFQVVAGYYSAITQTPFEEAVVPYVLVMPDKVDKDNFLPATRSMLIKKTLWKKVGKFDETLSDNEDYEFAKRLEESGIKIGFARSAIVNWMPRSTFRSFLKMIFRFARGDAFAGIFRTKVLLIFVRYILGLAIFLATYFYFGIWILFGIACLFFITYILWSIYKNYRYTSRGKHWLPILQISSDLAVMWGSLVGLKNRHRKLKK